MNQQSGTPVGRLARAVGANITAFALYWLLSFALVQLDRLITGGSHWSHVLIFLGTIAGVGIALALKARITSYLLAGMVAFTGSKLAILALYGWNSVRGLEPNFAIMAAGFIGVCLGAVLATRSVQLGSSQSHAAV